MARTRKPCPACKKVSPYRPAADVCSKCQQLIVEALARREELKQNKELVPTRLGQAAHWNDTYYYRGRRDDIDVTARAIYLLAKELTIKDPEFRADYGEPGILGKVEGYGETCMLVDKKIGELLFDLNVSIHVLVRGAYAEGKQDGRNLLMALQSGELSQKDFNERIKR